MGGAVSGPARSVRHRPQPEEGSERFLECEGLSISYGGLRVLDDVALHVGAGEVVGIIGPNGAGKTTLFNQISGFLKPTSGTVRVYDESGHMLSPHAPDEFARCGVGRTFQITQPFGKLTVAENIMIGAMMRHANLDAARAAALRIARLVGLHDLKDAEAGNLPVSDLKRLEVARTLALEPRILLLDEVMAGQSPSDTNKMVEIIRAIRDTGVTVVAIEHNMQAIMSLSDRIVVLDSGKVIAEGEPSVVVRDPRVIKAYLGEEFVNAQGL
jgi:branched-chain amino acid transport system permease protein